jgi:hypothetical protein
VKAKKTAATEKATIPNKDTTNEPVASIRKPIKRGDKTLAIEPQTDSTLNPIPAFFLPKNCGGAAFEGAALIEAAMPKKRTEPTIVRFEPRAKVTNATIINSGLKKAVLFPFFQTGNQKRETKISLVNPDKPTKKLACTLGIWTNSVNNVGAHVKKEKVAH